MRIKVKCAGVIPIMQEDKRVWFFLVRHKRGNYWGFPKGALEAGEDARKGALRELVEETQLVVTTWLDVPVLEEEYVFTRDDDEIEKHVQYFVGKITNMSYNLQKQEILEAKWVLNEQLSDYITFPTLQQVAETAYMHILETMS